jgi:hypothetical protein
MSDTGKSSHSIVEPALKFASVGIEKLELPNGLFDGWVPISEESLSHFMPIIVCRKSDKYLIIDGCKRYKSFQTQGKKECACGIIEEDVDTVKAGLLRIRLNAGRLLHVREKFQFLGWLKNHLDQKTYLEQAAEIRLPANERHEIEQIFECRPWLIDAVMQGDLDAAVAPEMDHLSEADALSLINLFTKLSFSRQMQRELAEWLPEIAFFGKNSLSALLASEPMAGILANPRLNDPQKVAGIHDHAHAARFPLFAATKKAWTDKSRQLNPDPSKITFQPSPYFEKNTLEIRIKADDAETVTRLLQKLAAIDLASWQQFIDPTAK